MKFIRKVQHGQKMGRKLGFPTLNLNVGTFGTYHKPGVYACQLKISSQLYKGALHFGPKKGSKEPTLEIHVLNFNQMIYGHWISFRLGKMIRLPQKFENLEALKGQIKSDVEKIKKLCEKRECSMIGFYSTLKGYLYFRLFC